MGEILEDQDNVECESCFNNLIGYPKIILEDDLLCYFCAKKEFPLAIKRKKELELFIYQRKKKSYDEAKAHYDLILAQWEKLRKKFFEFQWWRSLPFLKNKYEKDFYSLYPKPKLKKKNRNHPESPKLIFI